MIDSLAILVRNEAVGRFLKLQQEELWAQLLRTFALKRGAARRVSFRTLTGEAMELTLQPKQTLFNAKQALLKKVAVNRPGVERGHRRDAEFFHGGERLADHTIAAMLPDEVSVVFKQVKRILDSDSEGSAEYEYSPRWPRRHED
ncbi:unnamed protein product [Symbiodinium pilosum]|uniref:Ubiquitin-like domain-containing protein n=1 Tax=Symbiodinium pilosum TaxID=2952 RepID=A0A812L6M7_SYMPI|nr:unnamed protein product [Symbiodinium pilosum]